MIAAGLKNMFGPKNKNTENILFSAMNDQTPTF